MRYSVPSAPTVQSIAWKRGLISGDDWRGRPYAGHKALHTCTSWYAYAAMFGSSRARAIQLLCYKLAWWDAICLV